MPHYLHCETAKVLDIPQAKVRVIQPALGGPSVESRSHSTWSSVSLLSKKAGRPVKILYTRGGLLLPPWPSPDEDALQGRATKDGKLTGVDNDILIDGGGYHSFGMITSYYAGQPCRVPSTSRTTTSARRVYTNKPCCGPKRVTAPSSLASASSAHSTRSPSRSAWTPSTSDGSTLCRAAIPPSTGRPSHQPVSWSVG